MKTVLLATNNTKKRDELKRLLKIRGLTVKTLSSLKRVPAMIENGRTFKANAIKKALPVSRCTDCLVLADDSGLEVDILRGAPGIRSARYAGPGQDDEKNLDKLLAVLRNVPAPQRGAQFRCVIALAKKGRLLGTVEGICRGRIGFARAGSRGFGYDPVFVIPQRGRTFAQMSARGKDRLSHRAKAIGKARPLIKQYA